MTRERRLSRSFCGIVGFLILASPAFSQNQPAEEFEASRPEPEAPASAEEEEDSLIEEIVISGQAYERHDAQSISETSFGAQDLKELRISDISDLARFTPGLEINTAFAASNPTLFIRGIGLKDYNANAAGAVSVYVDGITINSPVGQLFQLFDVRNVTVLKGPQSGRFGRNATAGAIIVDSNLPDGEWSSEGSIGYGSYNGVEILGAVGFPIIEDKLSGRVAFSYNRRDGYTRNGCAGWDPESHGYTENSRRVMEEYWEELDVSDTRQPIYKANGTLFPKELYVFQGTERAEDLYNRTVTHPVTGFTGFPWRTAFKKNSYDASGNLIYPARAPGFAPGHLDYSCVLNEPGKIWNYDEEPELDSAGNQIDPDFVPAYYAGDFRGYSARPTFEEFQGLDDFTNNAHDWAARGMFLFTPTENIEILLSVHGGQNLSDSFHLQMVPATEGTVISNLGTEGDPAATDQCTVTNPCRTPEDVPVAFREPTSIVLDEWNEGVSGEQLVPMPGLLTRQVVPEIGSRGGDPYLGFYDRGGKELLDVWGVSVIASWDLDGFSLHSLTGYEGNQRIVEDEGDGTPLRLLQSDWTDSTWQISQEFRVEAEREDYSWLVGALGIYEDLDAENRFPAALGRSWTQNFDQSLDGFSVFASGHFDLVNDRNSRPWLEVLRLSSNLAWRREQKSFLLASHVQVADVGVDLIDANCPVVDGMGGAGTCPETNTWAGVTGDVMLSWTPLTDDLIDFVLHLKYSRGMKNGHFNAGLTVSPDPDPDPGAAADVILEQALDAVPPEFIHSVEFGFDSSWGGDTVVLSGAFYRYWYQDLQIFDLVNEPGSLPTQLLLSSDANVYGVEAALSISPVDELYLEFGFNWLDSTFEDFVVSKRNNVGGGVGGAGGGRAPLYFDYSGNSTIAAPEFTLNGSVQYSFYVPNWGSISPRFDYSYQSDVFLDPQGFELIGMPAYWYMDLRLAYLTLDEDIEVAFWISNLTDQHYLVDVFDLSRQFDEVLQVWGEPRMFGVTVSFSY